MTISKFALTALLALAVFAPAENAAAQDPIGGAILGGQHACLSPTIGLPAEEHSTGHKAAHHRHRLFQPHPVRGGVGRRRRAIGPPQAEWQVAAKHADAGVCECPRHCLEQGHSCVSPGSVSENEAVAAVPGRRVDKPSDTALRESYGIGKHARSQT